MPIALVFFSSSCVLWKTTWTYEIIFVNLYEMYVYTVIVTSAKQLMKILRITI